MELELSEIEYDVLEELYFVQSIQSLEKKCALSVASLEEILLELYKKQYIKLLDQNFNEINNFMNEDFLRFQFVISKKGLFAHNSR